MTRTNREELPSFFWFTYACLSKATNPQRPFDGSPLFVDSQPLVTQGWLPQWQPSKAGAAPASAEGPTAGSAPPSSS